MTVPGFSPGVLVSGFSPSFHLYVVPSGKPFVFTLASALGSPLWLTSCAFACGSCSSLCFLTST